jgi:hypothetical protein
MEATLRAFAVPAGPLHGGAQPASSHRPGKTKAIHARNGK